MLEYRYDTQLLIDGEDLDEDAINDYIRTNIPGDCLLVVGDDMLIKLHYHTNVPWRGCAFRRTICCGSSRTRKRKSGSTSSI